MNHIVRPELAAPPSLAPQFADLTKSQLELVRDMNRILTDREFNQFIETARSLSLNPLKRQICSIVFSARDRKKRSMAIVTTIHGFRAIADRTGTYRPDDQPARLIYDLELKDPKINPLGISECTVTPYRFAHGGWHPVVGQIWWDEIAPIRAWNDERVLDAQTPWPIRPRAQIMKCAEAEALRKGWPETFANVYSEDEVDKARILDMTPAQAVEEARRERLESKVGLKNTVIVDMWDGKGLTSVPVDQFHDKVCEFLHDCGESDAIRCFDWKDNNRIAFQQFFIHDKPAALDLKKRFEALEKLAEAL